MNLDAPVARLRQAGMTDSEIAARVLDIANFRTFEPPAPGVEADVWSVAGELLVGAPAVRLRWSLLVPNILQEVAAGSRRLEELVRSVAADEGKSPSSDLRARYQ